MNCIELSLYNEYLKKERARHENRFSNPAFAVVTSLAGNATSCAIVHNHDLEPLDKSETGRTTSSLTEFAHLASARRSTQATSGSATTPSGTNMSGHLGHAIFTLGTEHLLMFKNFNKVSAQRDVGTIVNSTSPDTAIFMSEGIFWIGKRSFATDKDARMGHKTGLTSLGATLDYGSIGFNEKTGTLAVLTSNSTGTSFTLTAWENLSPPQDFESSEDFFTQDGIETGAVVQSPTFPVPGGVTPTYTEDKRRAVVVVCDDGSVVCSKMHPHQGFVTFSIQKNASGNFDIPSATPIFFHHWTTTYGCEQGDLYGIRHVVSLDGKFVAAYAAGYYYGSGIRLSITRVLDGKTLTLAINDSSSGYQVIPINASEFILTKSYNADGGKGLTFYKLDMLSQFETAASGTTLDIGTAITGKLDSGYYSTNYPVAVAVQGGENNIFKAGESE